MNPRYLPLLDRDGSWIPRPSLFLLARMAYEDDQDEQVVRQLYDTMCRSYDSSKAFNLLEADIEKRHVRRNHRFRTFAGWTILELFRIADATGWRPSVSQAVRLVAFNQRNAEAKKASPESLEREVRKGFSDYRNTAHLQAALIAEHQQFPEAEVSETALRVVLGCARFLEQFMEANVVGERFQWNPWRVPTNIEPIFRLEFRKLSLEELAVAKIK